MSHQVRILDLLLSNGRERSPIEARALTFCRGFHRSSRSQVRGTTSAGQGRGDIRMKTQSFTKDDTGRAWFVVDAENKVLGRLATEIAKVLRASIAAIYPTR